MSFNTPVACKALGDDAMNDDEAVEVDRAVCGLAGEVKAATDEAASASVRKRNIIFVSCCLRCCLVGLQDSNGPREREAWNGDGCLMNARSFAFSLSNVGCSIVMNQSPAKVRDGWMEDLVPATRNCFAKAQPQVAGRLVFATFPFRDWVSVGHTTAVPRVCGGHWRMKNVVPSFTRNKEA